MTGLYMRYLLIASLAVLATACSSPDNNDTPDQGADTSTSADMGQSTSDTGFVPDAAAEPDMGPEPDQGVEGCASFPAPLVAGTDETDSLANSAGQCGQADFAWLRDGSLGDITAWGGSRRMNSTAIVGLAAAEGLELPPPKNDVRVTTFSYRTQDRGEFIEATSLLAVPEGLPEGATPGVVLFLHGTTGFNDSCAPSSDIGGQLLAAIAAAYGNIVVAPDYIGLKSMGDPSLEAHPYLVGQATAIASLDAVRAVFKSDADHLLDLCPRHEVALWGISQGGHATLWTKRLAPYYAREIDLVGGVAAVPPANLYGHSVAALTTLQSATSNLVATLGAGANWYGADPSEVFAAPFDVDVPAALLTDCNDNVIDDVTELEQLFTPALLAAAQGDELATFGPWGCMLTENSLHTTSVAALPDADDVPLLLLMGENDELVNPTIEVEAQDALCESGEALELVTCAGEDHISANLVTIGAVVDYIEARFNGEPLATTCERSAPVDCTDL